MKIILAARLAKILNKVTWEPLTRLNKTPFYNLVPNLFDNIIIVSMFSNVKSYSEIFENTELQAEVEHTYLPSIEKLPKMCQQNNDH